MRNTKGNILKPLVMIILAVLGIVVAAMAADTTPSQMSDELRSMVINLKPKDIGITKESFPNPVYALVMETGFPEGSFTLSSVADGSTSLYFSNGVVMIGGGEHVSVREASGYLLSGVQRFYKKAKKVTSFPKPEAGKVIFYFITFGGVRSYTALEDDLGNEKDELSNLFFAAHNVITELRKIEENTHNKAN